MSIMDNRKSRKYWGRGDGSGHKPIDAPIIHHQDVKPEHEEYLLRLQDKNRKVKKLQEKKEPQKQREKQEQGFTLYVNGANSEMKGSPGPRLNMARPSRTAGDGPRSQLISQRELERLHREEQRKYDEKKRARTAPSKVNRKNWHVQSIDIKTEKGDRRKLKAPQMLTGNYDDDFEVDESERFDEDQYSSSDDQGELAKRMSTILRQEDMSSGSESEINAAPKNHNSNANGSLKRKGNEKLLLSISDLRTLRRSLELNKSIQQSLAEEISSDCQQDIPEELDLCSQDEDFEPELGILEEQDEIEEDLIPSMDTMSLGPNKSAPTLKYGDTIVLEFAPTSPKKKERTLSGVKRKDGNTEDYHSSSRKSPNQKPQTSAKSRRIFDDIVMKSDKSSKKISRPLSANRKSQDQKKDSDKEASAVMSAMKAENEKASKFGSRPGPQKNPQKIVPLKDSSRDLRDRPMSPSSSSDEMTTEMPDSFLTNRKLSQIMNKVVAMMPKQQRRLMKMLGSLEQSTHVKDVGKSTPKVSSLRKQGKSLSPITHLVDKSQKVMQNMQRESDMIEVNIVLLSNWGHRDRVGLTEVQFFDGNKKLIPLVPEDVTVHNAHKSSNNIDILFNGKTKTNKERCMWSCQYHSGYPVELLYALRNPDPEMDFDLSKIKIWNYNESIKELVIGVKQCKIFIGSELIFDGVLEKGCGNHVYDYSHVINVQQQDDTNSNKPKLKPLEPPSSLQNSPSPRLKPLNGPSPSGSKMSSYQLLTKRISPPMLNPDKPRTLRSLSRSSQSSGSSNEDRNNQYQTSLKSPRQTVEKVRSETRTLKHSVDPSLHRPSLTSDDSQSSPDTDTPRKGITSSKTPKKSKRMAARLDGHTSETDTSKCVGESGSKPLSPFGRKSGESPGGQSFSRSVHDSVTQSNGDMSMLQKLKEMNNSEDKRRKDVPRWLTTNEATGPFESPVSSSSSDSLPMNTAQANSRALSALSASSSRAQSSLDHLQTVFDGVEGDRVASPQQGSIHEEDERYDDVTPMQKIQQNRSKWRESQQQNLEESWGSLNLFNKSHRGRLSVDMEDDALEEYLNPVKKPSALSQEPIQEEDVIERDYEDFTIPELPYGKTLTVGINTTWGDHHYVGLTGIELFSSSGEPVQIAKIVADPPDINIMAGYGKDPRVVGNLIDGTNRTRDDVHMWLAPFTTGDKHIITMTFEKPVKLALIRVWNYNKSRIHSYRGAKDVEMILNGTMIFSGEIARACGGTEGGTEAFGDTILFTTDEDILDAVSKHDAAYEGGAFSDDGIIDDVPFERPRTADEGSEDRPFTRATGIPKENTVSPSKSAADSMISYSGDVLVYKGSTLQLNFTATWGDVHYLGLTGLEVVGKEGEAIPFSLDMIDAQPRDVHSLPGHEEDDRTLDKLIDGCNIVMSDEHMWLIPFSDGQNHTLTVHFGQPVLMAGLRLWNYNKSPEDTFRGAKSVHVSINGNKISPAEGYLIRKGPGSCHFDFAQEISFAPPNSKPTTSKGSKYAADTKSPTSTNLDYDAVQMPCGFIYQFHLLSTWADPYYIGLNAIELYDVNFEKIELTQNNISAYPDSVNVLEQMSNDVRTPDKLIDGVNSGQDGQHMWLAPILPTILNRVYVIFDLPTTVSMIKIWNYSKTPGRGVKDFALLVDDLLVYNGTLQPVSQGAKGILPTCDVSQAYHTISFTENRDVLRKEKHTLLSNLAVDQDVQLTNDKKIMTHYSDPKRAQAGKTVNQELRPMTTVSGRVKGKR